MIGIYKITNLKNGKIYIGQSIHIERRWQEHCRESAHSVISDAIKKEGKDNFKFEVIKECKQSELDELEQYYIHYYNCTLPYGYNVMDTVESHQTSYIFNSKETIDNIINQILNTDDSFQKIAKDNNVSVRTIYYINRGDVHYQENRKYPLRETITYHKYRCCDCGKLLTSNSLRCVECHKFFLQRDRPSREELKHLIRTTPFTKIGKKYGLTDNAIRKWCKTYQLPFRVKDIKQYSDEEWERI